MSAAPARSKSRSKRSGKRSGASDCCGWASGGPVRHSPAPARSSRLGAYYSAGPALSLGTPVQARLEAGEGEEREEPTPQPFLIQRQEETAVEEPEEGEEEEPTPQPLLIQRQEEDGEEEEPAPQPSLVQRQEEEEEETPPQSSPDPGQGRASPIRAFASRGLSGASRILPGSGRIQQAFGHHDVSDVRVRVSGPARRSNEQLRSRAYTWGNRIAFKQEPDLSLAAHEAAHVVQQRRGIHLKEGIGKAGDPYEQQADRAADAVVAGRSAQGILDTDAQTIPPNGSGAIQRACAGGSCGAQVDEEEATVQPQLEVNAERQFEPPAEGKEGEKPEPAAEEEPEGEAAEAGEAEAEAEGAAEAEEGEGAPEEAEAEAEAEEPTEPAGAEGGGAPEQAAPEQPREMAGTEETGETGPAAGGGGAAPAGAGEAGTTEAGGAGGGGAPRQTETSGAGEQACEGGGGAVDAECYDEDYEEPEEEPDEEPEEPESTESEEDMDSESEEEEPEEDDCPVKETVESEAQAAAPAEGSVAEASGGEGEAGAGAPGTEAEAAGGAEADGGAAPPEAQELATRVEANTGEAEAVRDPMEARIAQTEAQRGEAVAAYHAAAAQLEEAGQSAQKLAGGVRFASQEGMGEAGRLQRAEAGSLADAFFGQVVDQIEETVGLALEDVPERLGGMAEAIKGELSAAIETQKAVISARVEAARGYVAAQAQTARQHIIAQHDTTVATMEAETAAAIQTLQAAHQTSMGQVDEKETDGLDQVSTLYSDSREAHEQLGVTIGSEAISRGQEYVDGYEDCKIYRDDSFWAGALTDRRAEAQQNAAREVASGYQKNIQEEAQKQARKAMEGRQKDRCGIIAAARRARNTLDDQVDGLVTSLEAGLEKGIQDAAANRDRMLGSVDAALDAILKTLDQQERTQRQAANDTGYLQQVTVEQAAHSAAASVQTAVAQAVASLQRTLVGVQDAFAGSPAPEPEALDQLFARAMMRLESGLGQLVTQVDEGTAQAEERLSETGARAHTALANVTQSNDAQATGVSESFAASMATLKEGASTSFGQQKGQYVQQVQTTVTNGTTGFQEVVTRFDEGISTILTNVGSTLEHSENQLEESLRNSLDTMDCEIPKQADKAASKEQPAWKTVVAVVLIIVIIIVVVVVAGPAVIGAVGAAAGALGASAATAGVIGTVLGGALVGAATSATIQVINNWRTGQDLSEGVVTAAAIGFAGGALGAFAGLGVGALAARYGLSMAFQFAGNVAADGVIELGTQLVTTGGVSWSDFGIAMGISVLTAGFGEIPRVKGLQARVQHRAASTVPGAGARTYAESIRPGAGAEAEAAARAEAEGEAEAGAPTAARTEAKAGVEAEPAPRVETETETGAPTTRPAAEAEAAPPPARPPEAEAEPGPQRTGHPDAPEVEPGVVAKHVAGGHETKVLQDGRLAVCSTECGLMRMRYSQELADNPNLKSELDRIEAISDPDVKAEQAANLRQQLEDIRARGVEPEVTGRGADLAREAGLPDAPDGYQWNRQPDGSLVLGRSPGRASEVPPLRYEPELEPPFRPDVDTPEGYQWAPKPDGGFEARPVEGEGRPLEYDPRTDEFVDPQTGERLSAPREVVSGETEATRIGKDVHKQRADQRRESGEFDEVNGPIKTESGEDILVPRRVDLETGQPQPGTKMQTAQPDAVNYRRGLIVDDKPTGRPIAKDRQEIIRFIEAFRQRTGRLPETIEIHRYDPSTGQSDGVEVYSPQYFLP